VELEDVVKDVEAVILAIPTTAVPHIAGLLASPPLAVAGDDPRAKAIAFELVDAAGFDAVDAGGLAESWRQQPGTPAYCTELTADDLRTALARGDRTRAPEFRETLLRQVVEAGAA
jgi:hypothetical protein